MDQLYREYQNQAVKIRYRRMELLCRIRAGGCTEAEAEQLRRRLAALQELEHNLRFALRNMRKYKRAGDHQTYAT